MNNISNDQIKELWREALTDLTDDELKEMYECAKKIMENIPNDNIGISFLELRDKVGSHTLVHGIPICMNNKWISKKDMKLVINKNK